jgi:phage repressor protein C with HTH and peptisase S24 domain
MLSSAAPPLQAVGTRPRLPVNGTAGQNEIMDGVTLDQCEQVPVVPMFPNYTFTMKVTGESMLPYINPGDEVACLKIEESSFLQWGRIYVLFTSQGVIVKKIFDSGDGIRCVSFNESFPDFIVPKSEIYSFNLVIGLVRICN